MRTILVILSALGAAILVLSLLKNWQRRLAEQRRRVAVDVDDDTLGGMKEEADWQA